MGFSLDQTIIPAVAPAEQISELIERFYYGGGAGGAGEGGEAGPGGGESDALAAIREEVAALSEEDLEEESN